MTSTSTDRSKRGDAARTLAMMGAVLVPLMVALGLIWPGSDTTQVMASGWAAIGTSALMWILLRRQGRTGAPYIAVVAANFILTAALVHIVFRAVMPTG